MIRPVRGFPRHTGWLTAPAARARHSRQPGRAWLSSMDQVSGFRGAIHLQGSTPDRKSGAVSGARAVDTWRSPSGQTRPHALPTPKGRQVLERMAGTGAVASGTSTGTARSAARFRSAQRSTPAGRDFGSTIPMGRALRGRGLPDLMIRHSRAGIDCDACSLQGSRPSGRAFGSTQWTPRGAMPSMPRFDSPVPSDGVHGALRGARDHARGGSISGAMPTCVSHPGLTREGLASGVEPWFESGRRWSPSRRTCPARRLTPVLAQSRRRERRVQRLSLHRDRRCSAVSL